MMSPLRRTRLAAGLTQTALAKKIGCDTSNVSKWESGDCKPMPKFIPKLANAFKKTPEEVIRLFETDPEASVA